MQNIAESGTLSLCLVVIELLSRREWNYVSEEIITLAEICFVTLIIPVAMEAIEITILLPLRPVK